MSGSDQQDQRENQDRWRNWGEYPLFVIIAIVGALTPVVLLFTSSTFFLNFLSHLAKPEEVANKVAVITIVAGTIFATLYLLSKRDSSSAKRHTWNLIGRFCLALVWVLGVGWVIQTAAPMDNSVIHEGPPPFFTPNDSERIWHSIVVAQNITQSKATLTLNSYLSGGTSDISYFDLAPGASWMLDYSKIEVPPGDGSAVMSSDQLLYVMTFQQGASIENPNSVVRLSLPGSALTGQKLYFPIVKNNYHGVTTSYSIQNTGSSPTTFRARFVMQDSTAYEFLSPTPVEPGAAFRLQLEDAEIPPGLDGGNNLGSLIVESDGQIFGAVYEHATNSLETTYSLTGAAIDVEGYTEAYIAERGIGKVINMHIINADTKAIDLEVSYGVSGTAKNCNKQTFTFKKQQLPPDTAVSFLQESLESSDGCLPWAWIEGTGKFLAFVSEMNSDETGISSLSYGAHSVESITTSLAFPFFADNYQGIQSTLQIRSTEFKVPATITATFQCTTEEGSAFKLVTKPIRVSPFDALILKDLQNLNHLFPEFGSYQPNSWCSVIVESDQPVVGFITERSNRIELNTRVNYDGANLPSRCTETTPCDANVGGPTGPEFIPPPSAPTASPPAAPNPNP